MQRDLEGEYRRLFEEIKSCRKCRLREKATQTVPGEGNIRSGIMFVGEAPGRQEDIQGRPFVGAAGKLLTELIESVLGMKRDDVYITNVVKCRPPGNRDPLPDEIEACSPYLLRQIELIDPDVLVALGRHAARFLLELGGEHFSSLSASRGRVYELRILGKPRKILVTYHPAAALYNPQLRSYLESDFGKLADILGISGARGEQRRLDQFFGD